jgi:2-aminoethylphosphonate-pyruvate transaminase
MQAVILAAGQGQRIREHHSMPKGFIEVNETPLIYYSLEILRSYGIKDILLVTGYQSEYYEKLAQKTGWFETVYNPDFATYGNLYSLYVAKDWIKEDVIIAESDIIYEPRAIEQLLATEQRDVILTSGATQSGDEVYVEVQNNVLVDMSKVKTELNESAINGEFVGLTRLSTKAYRTLCELAEQDDQFLQQGYYDEAGLVQLSKVCPLHCHFIEDLQWSEIDDVNQLQHARDLFPHAPIVMEG